jgi:heme/copper-type cytochrome/quinol oxidase subunit 4
LFAVLLILLYIVSYRLRSKNIDENTSSFIFRIFCFVIILLLLGSLYCLWSLLTPFFPVAPADQFVLLQILVIFIVFLWFSPKFPDEKTSFLNSLSYMYIMVFLFAGSVYCLWRLILPVYSIRFFHFYDSFILILALFVKLRSYLKKSKN